MDVTSPVTLETFARDWASSQSWDPATAYAVESRLQAHVYPHLGDLELRAIRPSTIQRWIRDRSKHLGASYVVLILGHLSTILAAAVEDGLIARNPCGSRAVRAPQG